MTADEQVMTSAILSDSLVVDETVPNRANTLPKTREYPLIGKAVIKKIKIKIQIMQNTNTQKRNVLHILFYLFQYDLLKCCTPYIQYMLKFLHINVVIVYSNYFIL